MKQDARKRSPHYRPGTNLSQFKMSTANHRARKAHLEEQSLQRESSVSDSLRQTLIKAWTSGTCNVWRKWSLNQVLLSFSSRKRLTPNNQNQCKYKRCILTRSKLWPASVGITNLLNTQLPFPNRSFQDNRQISTTITLEFSFANNLFTNLKVNAVPEIAKSFWTIDTNFSIFYFFFYFYQVIYLLEYKMISAKASEGSLITLVEILFILIFHI
jgi:hypothetical protein